MIGSRAAMAESWTINVSGSVYGPYTLAQMQSFHAGGRLADQSMVAGAGEDQFHPACEDLKLAPLFNAPPAALVTLAAPAIECLATLASASQTTK